MHRLRPRTRLAARAAAALFSIAGAAALWTCGASPGPSSPRPQAPVQLRPDTATDRFDGEYGLWVRRHGDTLLVSWITRAPGPGRVEILAGRRTLLSTTTPAAARHTVTLPRAGEGPFTLRYGAAEDAADRHETVIRRPAGPARVREDAPDTLVVMSDLHGEFARMTQVLQNAGILDTGLRWAGGRRQLVIAGDVMDRGPDATRILWFLYGLEAEAQAAGGRVHLVLGNHEIMVMSGDLRYLSPRDRRLAELHGTSYQQLFDPARSVLGQWLRTRPPVLRIGDVLFAHGGIALERAAWSLEQTRDSLTAYTAEPLFTLWFDSTYAVPLDSAAYERRWAFFWAPTSVFWYRGYVQTDTLDAALRTVLDRFDARLHVVGHTPIDSIQQRYGGALIDVNTMPFAAEALMLVRSGGEWERWRVRPSGGPQRLR